MYHSRASLILVVALLSGCSAAFTAADTTQASAQEATPLAAAPAANSIADRTTATDVAVATPGAAQREGVQLEAQDLDSVMWVADAQSATPAKTGSHASDGKPAGVRLTAKDLDSLL